MTIGPYLGLDYPDGVALLGKHATQQARARKRDPPQNDTESMRVLAITVCVFCVKNERHFGHALTPSPLAACEAAPHQTTYVSVRLCA